VVEVRKGLALRLQRRARYALAAATIAVVWLMGVVARAPLSTVLAAQTHYDSGQNVVPVYEGWERNADGSFSMVFGYMNRNYEEELDIPVGPDNNFRTEASGTVTEPRVADQGQPTHFYPRRQQFMFRVNVPKDWTPCPANGSSPSCKDLVWSLTARGKTEKAYGSLWPVWEIDYHVYQQNRAGPGELGEKDQAPTMALVGSPTRTIKAGQPLAIAVTVKDDGLPTPRATRSGSATAPAAGRGGGAGTAQRENPTSQGVVRLDPGMGLGVVWVVHRRSGPANVKFEPAKVKVASGQASTSVTIDKPGTYVLRGYADDGVLLDSTDVTVTVTP